MNNRRVQFIGKDNVPFHTVIFPATLLGTGMYCTACLLCFAECILYNRRVQYIGKDNVPFHTVIFPATLLGTGMACLPFVVLQLESLKP